MLSVLVVAGILFTMLASVVSAADPAAFDWMKYKGTQLNMILNKHPYSESLIGNLPAFEAKTGIKVKYESLAETEYFQKLRLELSTKSGQYDVFMTGPMLEWEYSSAGWLEPLDPYLSDPAKTDQKAYNADDLFPALMAANRWDLNVGSGIGQGHQWAIPVMVETYVIPYRADLFDKYGLKAPVTLQDMHDAAITLREKEGGDFYGVVTRGQKEAATVATGFVSTMMSFMETKNPDLDIVDGKLKAVVNQPKLVDAAGVWVDMIKKGGPPGWTSVTWYDGKELFTTGKYGMYPDCDFFAQSYENKDKSQVAGKVKYVPSAHPADGKPSTGMWTWALAMSADSKNKDAAWYLIQFATSAEAMTDATVKFLNYNPTRKSVWENPDVVALTKGWGGGTYRDAVTTNFGVARIAWTPSPAYMNIGDLWAAGLHDIWSGAKTPKAAMDDAAAAIDQLIANQGIKPGPAGK
jgi:multiple sugar transport system substrate-binding protein